MGTVLLASPVPRRQTMEERTGLGLRTSPPVSPVLTTPEVRASRVTCSRRSNRRDRTRPGRTLWRRRARPVWPAVGAGMGLHVFGVAESGVRISPGGASILQRGKSVGQLPLYPSRNFRRRWPAAELLGVNADGVLTRTACLKCCLRTGALNPGAGPAPSAPGLVRPPLRLPPSTSRTTARQRVAPGLCYWQDKQAQRE